MSQDEYEGELLRDDVSSAVSRYTPGVWFFKGNEIIGLRRWRCPLGHQSEGPSFEGVPKARTKSSLINKGLIYFLISSRLTKYTFISSSCGCDILFPDLRKLSSALTTLQNKVVVLTRSHSLTFFVYSAHVFSRFYMFCNTLIFRHVLKSNRLAA